MTRVLLASCLFALAACSTSVEDGYMRLGEMTRVERVGAGSAGRQTVACQRKGTLTDCRDAGTGLPLR